MKSIKINNVELELDLLDADVMEKFENLTAEVVKKVQEPKQYKDVSNAEGMRIQCRYLNEFFDNLFGEGTAYDLFGDSWNLGDRMEAFGAVAEQSVAAKKEVEDISSKYSVMRLGGRGKA